MSYRESFDVKEIEDAQSIQLNTAEKLYLYKKAYDAKIDRSYRMLGFFGKAYVRFKCKRIIKQATEQPREVLRVKVIMNLILLLAMVRLLMKR